MRVTHHALVERVINNVDNRLEIIARRQEQISTGRRVSKPSHDPTAAGEITRLNSEISRVNQYYRNIESGISNLRMTETALSEIKDMVIRSRAIALQGANDTLKPEDRKALAGEIEQILSELLRIANQKYGSRYLFGGTETREQPYKTVENANGGLGSVITQFDDNQKDIELQFGEDNRVSVSVNAGDTFDFGEGQNLFDTLINLKDNLESNNSTLIGAALPELDIAFDQLNAVTSLIGARVQSAENMLIQYESRSYNLTDRLSELADVDIMEAITRLSEDQNSYELALRISAKVIQPSLVNFVYL